MVSGGDDSALYAAEFDLLFNDDDTTEVHVIRDVSEPSAHTSSVTGNHTIQFATCFLGLSLTENEVDNRPGSADLLGSHDYLARVLSVSQPVQSVVEVNSWLLAWHFEE